MRRNRVSLLARRYVFNIFRNPSLRNQTVNHYDSLLSKLFTSKEGVKNEWEVKACRSEQSGLPFPVNVFLSSHWR
jgi:hypothetical protein